MSNKRSEERLRPQPEAQLFGSAKPVLALLRDAAVTYRGRARAKLVGGTVAVIAKADGSVIVHDLERNTKPLFYNPAGRARWEAGRGSFHLSAVSAEGESLRIVGHLEWSHTPPRRLASQRSPRVWVAGTEADLVTSVLAHPSRVGLLKEGFRAREQRRVGGRVDLLFESCVVEVKKNAGVSAYDQAARYLRAGDVERVFLVCLNATRGLQELVKQDPRLRLIRISQREFDRYLDSKRATR